MLTFRRPSYWCCALVAAVNARICLGGSDVSEEEFERLVNLVGCRHEPRDHLRPAYDSLGLQMTRGPCEEHWVRRHLPVQIFVWSPAYGFHEILTYAVDGEHFFVVGAEEIKKDGRFTWQDLKALVDRNPLADRMPCRTFRLTK